MPIDEETVNLEIFLEKSNYWTKNGTKVKFIITNVCISGFK
nr:hypothetical protein [Mycoplasmopsis bovis]